MPSAAILSRCRVALANRLEALAKDVAEHVKSGKQNEAADEALVT